MCSPRIQYFIQGLSFLSIILLSIPILLPGMLVAPSLHLYLVLTLGGFSVLSQCVFFWCAPNKVAISKRSERFNQRNIPALPVMVPLLLVLLWLTINLWSSADPITSWIATGYLLLGIVLYIFSIYLTSTFANPIYLAGVLSLIGTTLTLLFPFIAIWKPEFRLFYLPLYDNLQSLQLNIGETVHPNILAGALVLTLPVTLALSVWPDLNRRWRYLRYSCAFLAILQLGALFLSQSRGGYLAIIAALSTMILLRWPRLSYLLPVGVVGIFLLIRNMGASTLLDQLSSDSALGGWSGRLEIWQTSLTAIADFPFTGIGIGTFTTVIPLLYPLSFPIESYPHAHNLFLQVALDLGLPGLIAYLALLINLVTMLSVTLYRAPRHTMIHTLAIGAAGSLAGMLIHGLLDAVTWGTKLSFLPWLLFALITQLFLQVQEQQEPGIGPKDQCSA